MIQLLLEGIPYLFCIIAREKRFRKQPSRYGNTPIMESLIESLDDDDKKSDYFVFEDPKTNRSVLLNECDNDISTDSITRMNDFFNDMDTNKDDGMISIYSHHMKIFGKKYEGKDNDSVLSCIFIFYVVHSLCFYYF